MQKKTYRAPLALALAALFAATLVPISGADSTNTLYTFHLGGQTDPTWTMLKLSVTEEGVEPTVEYRSDAFRCPAEWGTFFLTGTPSDAQTYGGLSFSYAGGRTGYDVAQGVFGGIHWFNMTDDGQEACNFMDVDVIHEELRLGTVYVLHLSAGLPFEGTATLRVSGPGVEIVGISSGRTSVYRNETQFSGSGAVVFSPPVCGNPHEIVTGCPPEHMNPGGFASASGQLLRSTTMKFKHHPFVLFSRDGWGASNASITHPTGVVQYMPQAIPPAPAIGATVPLDYMGPPPGRYQFDITASASVGWGKAGYHIAGADIWFPEEV